MMLTQSPNVVIGIGNSMCGDDGAGPKAIEQLQRSHPGLATYRVVRQLLPEMAEEFAFAGQIVFVDAAVDLPPGEVETRRLNVVDRCFDVGHRFDPPQLLAMIQLLFERSPAAWCVRIGASRMEPNESLSPAVAAAIEAAIVHVLNLLPSHVVPHA